MTLEPPLSLQITRTPTVTLISSVLALFAGMFAFDLERAAPERTALHLPSNYDDVHISTKLRDRLNADESLSITAKSIKLYTTGGVVKLRGQVIRKTERDRIVAAAKTIAGVKSVDDQLKILLE